MKLIFVAILFLTIGGSVFSQSNKWQTFYEKSGYMDSPPYDSTINFCKKMCDESDIMEYVSIGKSAGGYDIPMIIVSSEKKFTSGDAKKSGKLVILIEASIHAGEPDGKDAGMMLLRDMAIHKKHLNLLDNMIILFIPVMNPDGDLRYGPYNRINQNGPENMGWRTNSQNLNLNRDFLKAETPEMQSWHKMFTQWLPDLFIDCHTTDGADYQYSLTYGLEIYGNMEDGLTKWQKDKYLPYAEKKMKESGHKIFPYIMFKEWHDPRSGLESWVGSPALSEGYTAIRNRIGILLETHMLKPYKTRVDATFEMIRHTLEFVNSDPNELKKINRTADDKCKTAEFRKKPYVIEYETSVEKTQVPFEGFAYHMEISDLTGGPWFKYSDTASTFMIDFYNKQVPVSYVTIPEAYIIPPAYSFIAERLKLQGVEIQYLSEEKNITVESYKFTEYEFDNRPYEGKMRLNNFKTNDIKETRTFPKGSAVIFTNQSTVLLILHALEPKGPSSFLRWGYFNAIFEQKEYSETYVMEKLAREMLEKDPVLKAEYEKIKKDNPEFAKNQWLQCNWFYQRTNYGDAFMGVYPVGKVADLKEVSGGLGE